MIFVVCIPIVTLHQFSFMYFETFHILFERKHNLNIPKNILYYFVKFIFCTDIIYSSKRQIPYPNEKKMVLSHQFNFNLINEKWKQDF